MRPFVANGEVWGVALVEPGDPRLVDREGRLTVGTADPATRTVHISNALAPPLLDRVMLHEVAHAVAMSYGLLAPLRSMIADGSAIGVEEWAARLVENHGVEAAILASESLGRPICVRGFCVDRP